jgi:hypothetical protein
MQVVDNQAFSIILIARFIPVPRNRLYRRFLGLLRESFQYRYLVDYQAFSVILIVRFIPVLRNRLYRRFLGLLREIILCM